MTAAPEARMAQQVASFDALRFVCCVYPILWVPRAQDVARAYGLGGAIDWVFLLALSTMLAAAACIVYRVF